jgi:hypothetical protein
MTRAGPLCSWLLLLWFAHGALGAEHAQPAEPTTASLLKGLVQEAVTSGKDAELSPHLSLLLGVSVSERTTPIRQLGIKSDDALRLFDVAQDNHAHIVLMSVSANNQVAAYLMTPGGRLLKAVFYQVGGETVVPTLGGAKATFKPLRDFWLEKARSLEAPR